jgi:hypothetical protein
MFFLFLLFLQPLQAKAKPYCSVVLAQLEMPLHSTQEAKDKAQLIVDAIIKTAKRKPSNSNNPYASFVVPLVKGKTLHSYLPPPASHFSSGLYADSAMVLSLPKKGEVTLWDLLTPSERKELAIALRDRFHQGIYDQTITGGNDHKERPKMALNDTLFTLINKKLDAMPDHENQDVEVHVTVGLSPRKMLAAADVGELLGVCRHANSAFAGLLGELGVKNEDIRLGLSDYLNPDGTKEAGHIWVELRNPEDPTEWLVLDATPGLPNPSESHLSRREVIRSLRKEILPPHTHFLIPVLMP